MESQLKGVAVATIVTGFVGVLMLISSLLSAVWIRGTLPDTYTLNTTGDVTQTVNTSGSCHEGLFVKCCDKAEYITVTSFGSFSSSNYSDDSCFTRTSDDFHGSNHSGFIAAQLFAALCLILTFLGSVVACMFCCVSKFQTKMLVPLVQSGMFLTAVLLLTLTLIIMGAMYTKFTVLLQPGLGWSLYVAVVADVVVLTAALLSMGAFVLMKRSSDPQYGHF